MVLYRVNDDEDDLWNDMVEADEPRHLERRSPNQGLFFTKKYKAKKLLKKAKKLKPIWKPKAKKLAKKLAIVGIPTAGVALAGGGGGFALSQAFGGGQGGFQIPQIPNFG